MKTIFVIVFFLINLSTDSTIYGQTNSDLQVIKKKITEIDSTIINDPERFLIKAIGHNMPKKIYKALVIFPKRIKGNSDWHISDFQTVIGNTIYKIKYHDDFNDQFYLTFYYFKNRLIYSELDYEYHKSSNTFYRRKEWYDDNKLIRQTESGFLKNKKHKKKASIDLLIYGNKYFKVFTDMNKGITSQLNCSRKVQ